MTTTRSASIDRLLGEFEGAWRDDMPVFACCRKSVATAVGNLDIAATVPLDATSRVQALRQAVEEQLVGHLEAHRCCSGHLADLAFDLPDLIAPVNEG
ncbi:MAG TPA: hypothetical protein VML96_03770 [Egibacteraceae bacterium]|nr:hypothetical protein [Egibacteraceae bacterium]